MPKGDDTSLLHLPDIPQLFPGNQRTILQVLIAFHPDPILAQPRSVARLADRGVDRRVARSARIADVQWWAEDAVVLAHGTGCVTINSVQDGQNLLGASAEKFRGPCLLTGTAIGKQGGTGSRQFFVWECEQENLKGMVAGDCVRSVYRLVCFRHTRPAHLLRLKVLALRAVPVLLRLCLVLDVTPLPFTSISLEGADR